MMSDNPLDTDKEIDEALSEYFTWKGEAIHLVNQTENYKRMKQKLSNLLIRGKIEEVTNYGSVLENHLRKDAIDYGLGRIAELEHLLTKEQTI